VTLTKTNLHRKSRPGHIAQAPLHSGKDNTITHKISNYPVCVRSSETENRITQQAQEQRDRVVVSRINNAAAVQIPDIAVLAVDPVDVNGALKE
jgi:hypothetical protein